MIIDAHAHLMAPSELYEYRAFMLASRGHHGRGHSGVTTDRLSEFAAKNVAMMDEVGTDVQFISPRPFHLMHSESPARIVQWWVAANNDAIASTVELHPARFRGVAALPQSPDMDLRASLDELERVAEMGFVGILLNPDPTEGVGKPPNLADPAWYPLYERLCELHMPALVHAAGCRDERDSYSNHFITEESIAILALAESEVFQRFPSLKLIISHGGGSVPYQVGRWRAARWRTDQWRRTGDESFDDSLRHMHFDTVLYSREALELLFKTVGVDRCLFGTERPGSGSGIDPESGRSLDDLKPVIDGIDWLTEQDRLQIYEANASRVFPRFEK